MNLAKAKPLKPAKPKLVKAKAKPKPAKARGKAQHRLPPAPGDRLAVLAAALRAHPATQLTPRTARLMAAGVAKMAQKVVEEAAEVAIDAVRLERDAVVRESADLFYNLTVLLTALDIDPSEIWAEMDRRQELLGIAEKLPKEPAAAGEADAGAESGRGPA
jgi:phosphoribosyl-ATP pyrophosphohydrolase